VRVHLAREHALELETRDVALESVDVLLDGSDRSFVALGFRELEQLERLVQARLQAIEGADDRFELVALPSELLRALRVGPDRRILEFPQDLGQPFRAALVVKDTP
jgi:hypothetical protein